MKPKKKKISVTPEEARLMIISLNDLRTKLRSEGRYTDVVDETIIKVVKAKTKKVKVGEKPHNHASNPHNT